MCTVNCRPTASNYQLSHLSPSRGSNPGLRGGKRECYHSATVAPASLEKCQHSIKSTFKKVKTQIQKGANPEKAAKRGYEQACEYLDFWNKTVLIQPRALTCLSKSLAHILRRELYSMGNTGLLRREAEMTLLHPHLGETRRQELRNSSFWDPSLFQSQLVTEGEDFLLKKGTSKDSQGFRPYKPFRGPHNKKRAPTGNAPMGATPHKAVTNHFPQVQANRISEAPGIVLTPPQGARAWKPLSPMTP